jgi:hypothetical protein
MEIAVLCFLLRGLQNKTTPDNVSMKLFWNFFLKKRWNNFFMRPKQQNCPTPSKNTNDVNDNCFASERDINLVSGTKKVVNFRDSI